MNSQHIKEIRAFNRFYTIIIGLLNKQILDSKYSLPEVRIMYEVYHSPGLTPSDIISSLAIDKGYLSRILRHFEKIGIVTKTKTLPDRRSVTIQLTEKGKKEFEILNEESDKQVLRTFGSLSEIDCDNLVQKMLEIRQIIDNRK